MVVVQFKRFVRDCRILGDVVSIKTVDNILYKVGEGPTAGDDTCSLWEPSLPSARRFRVAAAVDAWFLSGTRAGSHLTSSACWCRRLLGRCAATTRCSCRPSCCDDNGGCPLPNLPSTTTQQGGSLHL